MKCIKCTITLDCRCGNKYCSRHILPEIHNCIKMQEFRDIEFNKNKEKILLNAILIHPKIDKIN